MGYRAHIHTKHEIEYDFGRFNGTAFDAIVEWFRENNVGVYPGAGEDLRSGEWEVDKATLRRIPKNAYRTIGRGDWAVSRNDLKQFVEDMLAAKTGDEFAYISWF